MNVILTGASGGLGSVLAKKLLVEGYNLGLNYYKNIDTISTMTQLYPDNTLALPFDVKDYENMKFQVKNFINKFKNIDILINNAGVGGIPSYFMRVKPERHKNIIETNLLGTINCTHAVIPYMLKRQKGLIINISSLSSLNNSIGMSTYAVSKYAIEKLSEILSNEINNKNIKIISLALPPIKDVGMFANLDDKFKENMPPKMKAAMTSSAEIIKEILMLIEQWKNKSYEQANS